MFNTVLVVVAVMGCTGKTEEEPKKLPRPIPIPAASDPACTEQAAKLGTWLTDVDADGHRSMLATGLNIVAHNAPVTQLPDAPIVKLEPALISIDGQVVGDPNQLGAKAIGAMFGASKGDEAVLLIDSTAPWSAVVAVVNGALTDNRSKLTFAFATIAPTKAAAPEPSDIDAEMTERAKPHDPGKPVPNVEPNSPGLPGKVFKDCPQVLAWLPSLAKLKPSERDASIIETLPKAIQACGCKVKIASVKRLMWGWWGRDQGPALTAVTITMAKAGTKVTAKPTALWVETHQLIVDAAKAGQPVSLQ